MLDVPFQAFEDETEDDDEDEDEEAAESAESEPESPESPEDSDAGEVGAPRKRRRKRRAPLKSAAHEARIERYRDLVESRGWIFTPPTPEQPISSLFEDLTVKQIVTLGTPDRHELQRRRA